MPRHATATKKNDALRREAKRTIDQLSGTPLRFATDFLSYMRDRRSQEATDELLAIPGFAASLARGTKDIKAGRARNWRKVRGDV